MQLLALWHEPRTPFAYALADDRLCIRLRTARDDPRQPFVLWSDRFGMNQALEEAPMRWLCDDASYRYWHAFITLSEGRARYTFRLDPPVGASGMERVWYSEAGPSALQPDANWPDAYFHWSYLHPERWLTTPNWVRDAVCYEIFPDRFARGNPPVAPELHGDWSGSPPRGVDVFWGGDLAGVAEKAEYVASLGANLIWLTPIFAAPSNHKYDTTDYGAVDPHFGDDAIFARMVGDCRKQGIGILLDGVFNHSGAQFAPWLDVVQRGMDSPYWGWFDIAGESADPKARNYRTFAHVAAMPRLRTANPEVQAYLIERASRWMRMGIAGWRLDVADEVDMSFWRAFRREMRTINPEAYFVGEIAYNAARWLEGDQFDGVMNYQLRRAMLQFFAGPEIGPGTPPLDARLDADGFVAALGRLQSWHPGWAATAALNPFSTHDVPHWLTSMGSSADRWRLGMTFLMAYEGIPQLYYGDEVGLEGGYDPDCRRPMLWDAAEQNAEMLAYTRRMTRLRRDVPALRASGMRPLASGRPRVAAFLRGTSGMEEVAPERCPEGAVALVVLNSGDREESLDLDLALRTPDVTEAPPLWPSNTSQALDVLNERVYAVEGRRLRLTLPAFGAAIVAPK